MCPSSFMVLPWSFHRVAFTSARASSFASCFWVGFSLSFASICSNVSSSASLGVVVGVSTSATASFLLVGFRLFLAVVGSSVFAILISFRLAVGVS